MQCLYFDCFAGISGDMTLAALVDLGVPTTMIVDTLSGLPLGTTRIHFEQTESPGISARRLCITDFDDRHQHRSLADVCAILDAAPLAAGVRARSRAIFERIAAAEGRVHGVAPEQVHFHEVGAIDSLIDIVGVAAALEHLGPARYCASALPMGHGWSTCRHGALPLPAPATLHLLEDVPVYDAGVGGELVTPTGAGILRGVAAEFGPLPTMRVRPAGYGAGTRALPDRPNLLRVVLGEQEDVAEAQQVEVLETTIDDMSPEWAGYLLEQLLAAGALDVALIPAQMKKNRPGLLVSVVAPIARASQLAGVVLRESTAAGVRRYRAARMVLPRRALVVATDFGEIAVKEFTIDGAQRVTPEYESCRAAAARHGVALQQVYAAAQRAAADGRG